MKKATLLAACLLVACSSAASARDDYFGKKELPKVKENKASAPSQQQPSQPGINVGGDTFATATVIGALPYVDGGNTCSYADDYYPSCAVGGNSVAPDVVYSYRPTTDECVNIGLCNSSYDTIVHVYDTASNLIACNDDNCGLQSLVEGVTLTAGQIYYIVVDGWSEGCGDYVIEIDRCPPPCDSSCPPDGIAENEPACADEYEDVTNGGCNSIPPVFSEIPCDDTGVTVCGTYGTYSYQGLSYRDTDWYSITLTSPTVLEVCVCGGAPTQLAIVNAATGCEAITLSCGSVFGGANESVCCEAPLAAGTYWIFVSTDAFTGIACGTPYTMTLNGYNCPPVGVQQADWTTVKKNYR